MPPASISKKPIIVGDPSSAAPPGWERQYQLAGVYSRFYRKLTEALAPRLAHRLDIVPAAAAVLTREVVVPLGYLYLDRLLRLDALIVSNPEITWTVPRVAPFEYPARIEVLQRFAATSQAFAQALLLHQSKLWGLEVVDDIPQEQAVREKVAPITNKNFNASTITQKVRRVGMLAFRKLAGPYKPVPVLSTGYSLAAFLNSGFYGTCFADIMGKVRLEDGHTDHAVREVLRKLLAELAAQPLDEFLDAASALPSTLSAGAVLDNFIDFFVAAFPSSLLEKARDNLACGVETLRSFGAGPLIVGERGDLESVVLIAASKVLGMKSVNFQHGGHIGYLVDQAITLELEECICDAFISWGWTRYPDYPTHPSPPLFALPNPWLSERAKLWRPMLRRLRDRPRKYDFLFFSNRIHRFPTIPSGAYQNTTDYLREHGNFLVQIAREARRHRQTILHKPYNRDTADLMADALRSMEIEGGDFYTCLTHIDKGLSEELLADCSMVLWDQPGTGFLECLACGIPTLCCWPRLYNREEPHAAEAFAELESAGVVHRTAASLFEESARVKRIGLAKWMEDPRRALAVAKFSRSYGWADDDWDDYWIRFLRETAPRS